MLPFLLFCHINLLQLQLQLLSPYALFSNKTSVSIGIVTKSLWLFPKLYFKFIYLIASIISHSEKKVGPNDGPAIQKKNQKTWNSRNMVSGKNKTLWVGKKQRVNLYNICFLLWNHLNFNLTLKEINNHYVRIGI